MAAVVAAASAMATATATAMLRAVLRAVLRARSMETPTATLMAIGVAEIEVAAATEKLVAKAGGNYKAAAGRHRHQSTKKGNVNGGGTAAVKAMVTATP